MKIDAVTDKQYRAGGILNSRNDGSALRENELPPVEPQRSVTLIVCQVCQRALPVSEPVVLRLWVSVSKLPSFRTNPLAGSKLFVELCLPCATTEGFSYSPSRRDQSCHWCGRLIISTKPPREGSKAYCSISCEQRYYRSRRAKPSRLSICESCSRVFNPKRADALHCSAACKQKAYRSRRMAAA